MNITSLVNKNGRNREEIKVEVAEASKSYKGDTSKYGSDRPNMYKEEEKDKIKKKLIHVDKYDNVNNIYYKLSNK